MKHCNFCKTDKDESEYVKRKASRDGLSYKCRECANEHIKAWRLDNPKKRKPKRGSGVIATSRTIPQYHSGWPLRLGGNF